MAAPPQKGATGNDVISDVIIPSGVLPHPGSIRRPGGGSAPHTDELGSAAGRSLRSGTAFDQHRSVHPKEAVFGHPTTPSNASILGIAVAAPPRLIGISGQPIGRDGYDGNRPQRHIGLDVM